MTQHNPHWASPRAWQLAAGATVTGALALCAWGGNGKPHPARVSDYPAARPVVVPAQPVKNAEAVPQAVLPRAAIASRAVARSAAPTSAMAGAGLCVGVRLVDISGQGRDTTVWLGDGQGIEQLELGQRFRAFELLEVQPETEQGPALALLRGPAGTCRTASRSEALMAMRSQVESAPPGVAVGAPAPAVTLTPALANELVAALNLQGPSNAQ